MYKWKTGERGLLPPSSHGTGVGWQGGHWAPTSGSPEGLVPSVFSSSGKPQVRVLASEGLLFFGFWEKEGEEKM